MLKFLKYTLGLMGTNCYIVIDEETNECAVIDPGDEFERLKDIFDRRPELKIGKIILTHAHFDHMGALEELRRYSGAPLYVHEGDGPAVTDGERNLFSRFREEKHFAPADHLLKDEEIISIGSSSLRVMHTPGHTEGSICLIAGDTVVTGDTLFAGNIGRYDFPGGDYGVLMASLEKLKTLEKDYKLLPGHGPSTHLSKEKETNFYLI